MMRVLLLLVCALLFVATPLLAPSPPLGELWVGVRWGRASALAQNPFTGEPAPQRPPPERPAPERTAPAQNPFTGGPTPQTQAPPAALRATPATVSELGFFARLNRDLARFQREVTREMSARLRAIRDGETPLALLVGIGLAFLYGVIHAAGPGHGKAVVIGYFLTRQARLARGFLMGLQISVGHVVSAIVVAFGADLIFKTVWGTSAAELRVVQLASYAAIALIGAYMLVETARGGLHRHVHAHGHAHGHAGGHEHRPQGLLSLGVGVVPCTGAILVMLFALANGILLAGFLLVAAIAVGMTITMAALGVFAIVARSAVTRWAERGVGREGTAGRVGAALEYAGAVAIILIGIVLFWLAY
jgi:ABC-type nickel/cobalt efflux system permease component RcnA